MVSDHHLTQRLQRCNDHFLPLKYDAALLGTRTIQLREHSEAGDFFQFGERFLQILWNEQRFSLPLETTAGRELRILAPGTWNVEAGPDFRRATVALDNQVLDGDIEIHRSPRDWLHHGHSGDPAYGNVVLHAVWEAHENEPAPDIPVFEMSCHLDHPWRMLMDELKAGTYPYARKVAPGMCAIKWAMADNEKVTDLLETAGLARFEYKSMKIQRLAIEAGWEQAAYETIFESLGYKANKQPFRRLARETPLQTLTESSTIEEREALLFGRAGLLPDPSIAAVAAPWREHVKKLWDIWWGLGRQPLELAWTATGSRPFNSPQRRLNAGLVFLQGCNCRPARWLTKCAETCDSARDLMQTVGRIFNAGTTWQSYKDFTVKLPRPAKLIGRDRINEMLVNVLLPLIAAKGRANRDNALVRKAQKLFLELPRLSTNRAANEAVHRFLVPPSRAKELLKRACHQQGVQEIYRSFCLALHTDCTNCPFETRFPFEH